MEYKPHYHHEGNTEDACGEVLGIDERRGEEFPGKVAQIEYICCPIEAYDDRHHGAGWENDPIEEAEMPRLGDWELLLMRMLAVFLKPVTDTCDSKNAGQLHYPPDEYLHGKKRIADNGAYERRYEYELRDIGEEDVALVYILVMAPDDTPLP